ncbi:SAM-dependent methyltransferase [Arenimonas terrae]|jgi:cyclopropane-fatty-acyl-phospholipid synthase|uniref:Class I SAM-dependent methyltransferase n=1 Tax=Arenimonas terrae TaxID=2546226 RepID=A0A5C4RQY0_9GAMM|nr:cyclopropane-fatty-acyl-phospholipid synthase family protein [Arenimonas terrae]TNJ33448.1 class I SAM-dependent methyltransferase [Arenimonas terrae]
MSLIDLCERGLVPDVLTRYGIRRLCAQRLEQEGACDVAAADQRFRDLLDELRRSPIAIETDAANEQHYELPTRFFELCLGRRLKYSSAYYPTGNETLDEAEEAMLALYGERAGLADGQRILELGCGWGSLTLWMAERFPQARITGVSNSRTQREHILAQAARRGLGNVEIITCDVNQLELPEGEFDRAVSIEMFEHMRNYRHLLGRVSRWLKPEGKLFVHIFVHRYLMYPFETEGDDNWMGRYFFTGGLMPAADTLLHFQDDLALEQRWLVPGTHYQRTADHWLQNQDHHREEVMAVLTEAYGAAEAARWFQRWRMFWMACAELFGYSGGDEWLVAHYRFSNAR